MGLYQINLSVIKWESVTISTDFLSEQGGVFSIDGEKRFYPTTKRYYM